jgi:predicted enzyme related to lactoylglutathione lyase
MMSTKFAHVNLVARDWKKLARFYQTIFECILIPPERDLTGDWLDEATGLTNSQINGIHLRLPGMGDDGSTLEIFQYQTSPDSQPTRPNTPGFSHIAFAVDDVATKAEEILNAGGSEVGNLTIREIPGAGIVKFQYLRDPEGNIIEIQQWDVGQS